MLASNLATIQSTETMTSRGKFVKFNQVLATKIQTLASMYRSSLLSSFHPRQTLKRLKCIVREWISSKKLKNG
jgi:hypothetical protein